MGIVDLENELADARRAVSNTKAALLRRDAGALSVFRMAQERVLRAERALADARSQEHAIPCPGLPAWNTGAPHPHLFTQGSRAALVYLTREPDPTWDGRTARIVDPEDEELHLVAIVQFDRTVSVRMGSPNDEVIEGHPLFGKGLSAHVAPPHTTRLVQKRIRRRTTPASCSAVVSSTDFEIGARGLVTLAGRRDILTSCPGSRAKKIRRPSSRPRSTPVPSVPSVEVR